MLRLACLVVLVACSQSNPRPPVRAADGQTPIAIGETFRLVSRVLGEERVINVYLPPEYATSTERYPVLYMLDGGIKEDFPHVTGLVDVSTKNGIIRPHIVVGIENTVRRRDLVAATTVEEEKKAAPQAGGADRFRQFLRDELKGEVAKRYRVTAESALVGESLAGLFVVETLLLEPALFDTYIAIDPSIWWNKQTLVRSAAERLAKLTQAKTLYWAIAGDKELKEGVPILRDALRDHKPPALTVHYEELLDERHATIYPVAVLRAFKKLFAK